jgi:hypothetical protein
VVAAEPDPEDDLYERVRRYAGGDAEVLIVAVADGVDAETAVETALDLYRADELVVVTASDEEESWPDLDIRAAFGRFGLPVTHLVDDDDADEVRRPRT